MGSLITLCTDFGLRDGYVAAMKGTILSIAPNAKLVDISHDVTRQSVREGAFVLSSACRFFPADTVHLVVVDPGVGGSRRAVAVRTERFTFVAPDNGVLSLALQCEQVLQAVALTERAYWRGEEISRTFHGRDIFAPVAAHLANGLPLSALGEPVADLLHLTWPTPQRGSDNSITGQVVHVDHFGNIISDIPGEMLLGRSNWRIVVGKAHITGLSATYASASPGELVALIGSHGNLEIAVRGGRADRVADAAVGAVVRVG